MSPTPHALPRRRSWRALDDLDNARVLSSILVEALRTGAVRIVPMRTPSWVTIQCDTAGGRTHVELPAILGSGFDLGIDADELARHAIAACDDAGLDPQEVAHCTRMASLILGSVPDIRLGVHDSVFVSAFGLSGLPCASSYGTTMGTDEWMDRRADPAVVEAVGLLTPL